MKKALILLLFILAVRVFAASEDALYYEAEDLYRAGNYALALETYGELVSRYPLSDRVPDAQYRLAVILLRLQRYRESLDLFSEIEKRYRSTRYFAYVYFWQGLAFFRLEDYAQAVQAFSVFLSGTPDPELTPQALLNKAQAEIALADYAEAARDLEILASEHPRSPAGEYGLVLQAFAYLKQGRASDLLALSTRTPAESIQEKWRDLYRLYAAEALWAEDRQEQSVPIYSSLLAGKEEVSSVAYRRLFMAAEARDDLAAMQSLMQQAESRFAGSPGILQDLWVQVGIESFKQGKLDLAEYFLTRVWSLPDKRSAGQTVPLYLAEVRLARRQTAEAAAILEDFLALNPPAYDRVLLRLGDIRLMQGNFTEAAGIYSRYMESYPAASGYPEAGYLLAYARYRLGDLPASLELAGRLLRELPGHPVRQDLYRLLVAAQKKSGNLREAVSLLGAYIALYPEEVKARLDLLKLYLTLKDYSALLAEAARLQQAFPSLREQDPYAYLLAGYLRGLAELARKQYKNALAALAPISREGAEKAGLAAIYPYALYYQGWAHYRQAQYQEGRDRAMALLEGYPGHSLFPNALYLAGWCSFTLGDYRGAASYFARLAKTEGEPAVKALFLQGKSLGNLGEKQEAAQIFRTLYTVHAQSTFADDALLEYAGILAERGSTAEAAGAYRELAQKYPQSPLVEEALYKRGEVYSAGKLYQQARDAFYDYRSRFPKGKLVDASLYWGGIASYELGESFGAVLHWEKLIDGYRESPFRADALKRTAEAYAERGDFKKALDLLTALPKEYPEEARVFGTAQRMEELRYLMQGASDREALLSSLIGKEGGAKTAKGREAMIELAQMYIYEGSGRIDFAYQMLQSVVEKQDPATAPRAQFLIGEYYFRKGDPARAAQELLASATMTGQEKDRMAASLFRAAEMMQLAGRSRDVRELAARLEKFFPDSQWILEARKLLEGGGR